MGPEERREDNQGPIEEREQQDGAKDSADEKSDPVVISLSDKEGRPQPNCKAPARDKTDDADRDLLQKEREQCANESKHQRKRQLKERCGLLHYMRRELHSGGKAKRRYAKPKKLSP